LKNLAEFEENRKFCQNTEKNSGFFLLVGLSPELQKTK
jgi:hypothetical protein